MARLLSNYVLIKGERPGHFQIAGLDEEPIELAHEFSGVPNEAKTAGPLPPAGDGRLRILYSGNLGRAHDVDTVAQAISNLRGDPRISFTFAGGGPHRQALEQLCRHRRLPNVAFEPYCPAADLSRHLAACDIGLVTQNPATLGCVVPSKTYALMAAARPILFIGPPEATPAHPGSSPLHPVHPRFAARPGLVQEAGHRAHQAFQQHYNRPQGVARILKILTGAPTPVPLIRVHPL